MPFWLTVSLAGATACISVGLYGTFVPGSRIWGRVTSRGSDSAGGVALTFDDGPMPGMTDRILDQLATLRVPATFFVIGRYATKYPELVRRIHAEGHTVGNHSYDHAHFALFRGPKYWLDQVRRSDHVIADAIGQRPALFRPPMGFLTWPIQYAARSTGHTIVAWSHRGRDGIRADTGQILRRLGGPKAGDIQLLHDGVDPYIRQPVDRSATVAAIGPLISSIRGAGLEVIRLDRMLGIEPYSAYPSNIRRISG